MMSDVSFCDRFCPQSHLKWIPDTSSGSTIWWFGWLGWDEVNVTTHTIDSTTGFVYLNETPFFIQIKCAAAVVLTPLLHGIFIIVNVAFRIIKVVSFYSFWRSSDFDHELTLKERVQEWGEDGLRILIAPAIPIFLELAALYGMFNFYEPNEGKKIYYNIEFSFYGTGIVGELFQFGPVGRKHINALPRIEEVSDTEGPQEA